MARPKGIDAKLVRPERLQKVLARAGLGSRREIEGWIEAGRVRVNGKPAELGDKVVGGERVTIDERTLTVRPEMAAPDTRVIAYHKPEGEIVTRHDPEGRKTVFEKLPRPRHGKWVAVGRLDINTSGLILFTNNGDLANALMHPSKEVSREYAVRVFGQVEPAIIERLREGVELEDGSARFEEIVLQGGRGSNTWYHCVLREGRNREVRRLWESQGVTVSRLMRVRYGPIALPGNLPRGKARDLSRGEIRALRDVAGLPVEEAPPETRPVKKKKRARKSKKAHTPVARQRKKKKRSRK